MIQPRLNYYDMSPAVTAFSTMRHGGYGAGSSAPAACQSERPACRLQSAGRESYAEFNINRYCGDDEEHVRGNREALCSLLGISDSHLLMPHQVHQAKTARIDQTLLSSAEKQRCEALEGYDALMTDLRGVCIGVSTADCIPILLFDEAHHAVCAVHAGWRGTVARIAEKAVAEMTAAYDTRPEHIKAQIGPGIHVDSFEVGNEVYEAFDQAGFDMTAISVRKAKWHIDLPECNRLQLIAAGVGAQGIKVSPVCTFRQSDDYFSARRLGINSGRIFTGIMINLADCR